MSRTRVFRFSYASGKNIARAAISSALEGSNLYLGNDLYMATSRRLGERRTTSSSSDSPPSLSEQELNES